MSDNNLLILVQFRLFVHLRPSSGEPVNTAIPNTEVEMYGCVILLVSGLLLVRAHWRRVLSSARLRLAANSLCPGGSLKHLTLPRLGR
ncbi:hypothetical protein DL96DRAFT_1590579 [Flagelloscypha sp. PMI_526]|nr:hypothetical protein DL96DRAFT_1590579 [Flagelloscypha sp. PMI_526]